MASARKRTVRQGAPAEIATLLVEMKHINRTLNEHAETAEKTAALAAIEREKLHGKIDTLKDDVLTMKGDIRIVHKDVSEMRRDQVDAKKQIDAATNAVTVGRIIGGGLIIGGFAIFLQFVLPRFL